MSKNIIIGLIAFVCVAGLALGVYFIFFQEEEVRPVNNANVVSNVNQEPPEENLNTIGVHRLSNAQKERYNIDPEQEATLEVRPTNTSEGAVVYILDVEGDPDKPKDSDGDGITDDDEINLYGTDPESVDSDLDGLTDDLELFNYATNPNELDTDGDGYTDLEEISSGHDPLE